MRCMHFSGITLTRYCNAEGIWTDVLLHNFVELDDILKQVPARQCIIIIHTDTNYNTLVAMSSNGLAVLYGSSADIFPILPVIADSHHMKYS